MPGMLGQQKPTARIFINYRRDDTRWVAGRLIDSLRAYFGDDRVFRDIEGIKGGAEFGDVIHSTIDRADAVIVLIGPHWLSVSDEEGKRRLDDPEDWVAREIASALGRGVPIYPVLVDNTPMPQPEELPESIRPLVQRNAMSVSEKRWESDIERLAKIVGIDIPGSVAERTLDRVRLATSLSLLIMVALTTAILVWNVLQTLVPDEQTLAQVDDATAQENNQLPTAPYQMLYKGFGEDDGETARIAKPTFLPFRVAGLPYVAIMFSAILLLVHEKLVDESKRPYIHLAGMVGAVGTLVAFIMLWPIWSLAEPPIMFFGSTVIATSMLVLMNLSGFKPK